MLRSTENSWLVILAWRATLVNVHVVNKELLTNAEKLIQIWHPFISVTSAQLYQTCPLLVTALLRF